MRPSRDLGVIPVTLKGETLTAYGGPQDRALVAKFVARWIGKNIQRGPERYRAWQEIAGALGVIDSTELISERR